MQRLLDACFWPLSRFAAAHQFANELRHSGRADRALTSRMTWTDRIDLCHTHKTRIASRGIFVSPNARCSI